MFSINQLLAGAGEHDAITNYAFIIRDIFHSLNIPSHIYAPGKHIAPQYKQNSSVRSCEEYKASESDNDILLYHFSIGSPATETYLTASCRKCLCYHNITPSFYFKNISDIQVNHLLKGVRELQEIKDINQVAMAVSEFNRQELLNIGFTKTAVIPLKFPEEYLNIPPETYIMDKYKDGKKNLLFVGRIAPNKKIEDLIKIFYFYNKTSNPDSRLILVGTYTGNEKYFDFLKFLLSDLQLAGQVIFTGPLKLSTLIAYYKVSDAFICASEHEGFCLPLIEAMHFSLPVFALSKAAIPETMDNSGILFNKTDFKLFAEIIHYVLERKELLNNILETQRTRLLKYNQLSLKDSLLKILNEYFDAGL